MGLFSGKKKTYVGISNSRLYETKDIPNSLKDSTAGYISDLVNGDTRGNSLSHYNNMSIESSIVPNIRRAYKYVNKRDGENHIKFEASELTVLTQQILDTHIKDIILNKARLHYPLAEINYVEYDYLDLSHVVKTILDNDYSWNSYNNTMVLYGLNGWLENITLYLTKEQEGDRFGDSFVSGQTALRDKDLSRPFRPINLMAYKDYFTLRFMPSYEKTVETVIISYRNKTTDEVTDGGTTNTAIVDNQPSGEYSVEYSRIKTDDVITKYDKPSDNNIEVTKTTYSSKVLSYGEYKNKLIYFEDYIDMLPSDLPVINGPSATPDINNDLQVYINSVENGSVNIESSNIEVYVSLKTDSETNKHFIFKDTDTVGLAGDIASALKALVETKEIDGYMPDIHLKIKGKEIEKGDEDWRINYTYSKRLGIKLKGMFSKIAEQMENDIDKVRHAYITFGVDINSQNQLDMSYLFGFFNEQLDGLDTLGNRKLMFKTNSTNEEITWDSVTKTILTEELVNDFESSTENNDLHIKKRLSNNQCEYIVVQNYQRKCEVAPGKWGDISGESYKLVPLNIHVMKENIKGFKNKENFIYRCMYIEFLTYVEVKVKWYQTTIFKIIVILISAAITFFTGGAGSYWSALLVSAVTSVAIDYAIKISIKLFGAQTAKYIAYALILVGMGKGIGAAMSASTKVLSAFLMNASLLISIGNGFLNQSMQTIGIERKEEMDEKNRELKRFKEQTERLLGSRVREEEFQINRNYISSFIMLGSIEEIMYGILDFNKIDTCINYIHNYTEYMISLPTLDESANSILGINQ